MSVTLIFGGRGQLGRDLVRVFSEHSDVTAVDLPEIDISDETAVRDLVTMCQPDLVLNAAAYTDVEKAEEDEGGAFRVNEVGARNVARAARIFGAPVVFYSTDYVFGGKKTTPYVESDATSPIGVYARSKLAGERATREENTRSFIVRTAWLYGPGGNNFVEKILGFAEKNPSLKVVSDEIGSPMYTWDLAEATLALTRTVAFGIYHATNSGVCSRYEMALEILRLAGVDTPVEPCASTEFPTKAERPLYSVMNTEKVQGATDWVSRDWKLALADYMARRDSA